MFYVRVKIDPEPAIYFTISETANVNDLKLKLEEFVDIPHNRLEIIIAEKTLTDSASLVDISGLTDDSNEPNAISVYDQNKFIAFVRILSEEEHNIHFLLDHHHRDDTVSNEENNLADEIFQPNQLSNCQMPTLGSNETMSAVLKRGLDTCQLSDDELSIKKKKYLDACGMKQCQPNSIKCSAEIFQAAQDSCEKSDNKCDIPESSRPPYVDILPENRRFVLVIAMDCKPKCYCLLLTRFFDLFAEYESSNKLRFNQVSPVVTYDGQLYVAPSDEDTMVWVEEKVGCVGEPFVVEHLLSFLKLNRCTVIWPKVVEVCEPNSELVAIFQLLESQNCGVNTEKWIVIERFDLEESSSDYISEAVTTICPNETVELYIDDDSVKYIRDNCNQLRYCFWVIAFVFCE